MVQKWRISIAKPLYLSLVPHFIDNIAYYLFIPICDFISLCSSGMHASSCNRFNRFQIHECLGSRIRLILFVLFLVFFIFVHISVYYAISVNDLELNGFMLKTNKSKCVIRIIT